MRRLCAVTFALACLFAAPVRAESICDPDGLQNSGSVYRICMPGGDWNGMLVLWAHGFQDAIDPVGIPEDQLCIADEFCLNEVVNDLGFAFATNSYSKTGLAVLQGKADLLDLVQIFTQVKGKPRKVYLVGASEGGIITALSVEQHPAVYAGGVAACGPVGDFPYQLQYFGDARATFQYFFPGFIPGDPFNPAEDLILDWTRFYADVVEPGVFHPANRDSLDQWVAVAKLPFDSDDYLGTVKISVRDVLRYGVVNLKDAITTLGGFPFDNLNRRYNGSANDMILNRLVPRIGADAAAITAMKTAYSTSGLLKNPLITLHTRRDQQVPFVHEPIYNLKTLLAGTLIRKHLNIPVNRFGHCQFTRDEALFSFAVMLFYDRTLREVIGTGAFLSGEELTNFEQSAASVGLPTRRAGNRLTFIVE